MKRIIFSLVTLLSSPAFAADLPMQKHVATPHDTPFAWSGAYVGINAGGVFGAANSTRTSTWNTFPSSTFEALNFNNTQAAALLTGGAGTNGSLGFIGGGQIGYNQHIKVQNVDVVGSIETDIQGVSGYGGTYSRWFGTPAATFTSGGSIIGNGNTTTQTTANSLNYIGTVRGRIGVLICPSLLAFGTGGLAYGGVDTNLQNYQALFVTSSNSSSVNTGQYGLVNGSNYFSNTLVGWTAGGGLEWLVASNWSIKAEYLYYDLGKVTGTVANTFYSTLGGAPSPQSITNYSYNQNGNIVRLGLNYHFISIIPDSKVDWLGQGPL